MYIDGKTKGSMVTSPLDAHLGGDVSPSSSQFQITSQECHWPLTPWQIVCFIGTGLAIGAGALGDKSLPWMVIQNLLNETLASHTVHKGLLWQQRDRIFSRWKERYFVLTPDYLNCFRKAPDSGPDRISHMGAFLFKVKLVEVDRIEWVNKRSYSVVIIHLAREGRILLRSNQGLEEWHENLDDCRIKSRKRREMLRLSHDCYSARDRENDSLSTLNSVTGSTHEDWIIARSRIAMMHRKHLGDSVVDVSSVAASVTTADSRSGEEDEKWTTIGRQHNSLLGNVDLNSFDSSAWVPPSLRGRTPCRLNSDIFFMAGRQRASIAGPVTSTATSSLLRAASNGDAAFRLPNMLHSTRGIANRYSYAEDKISDTVYSTFDGRSRPTTDKAPS